MLKMIKMDLYRFFHSMSIWFTLFADIVLAVLSIILVYTMANNSASIQTYSDVGTLLAAQINGGILMILCTVSVTIFPEPVKFNASQPIKSQYFLMFKVFLQVLPLSPIG